MESRSCTPCSWGHAGQGPLSGLSVQGVFLSNDREQAEALAREGIAEYGRIRAERDGASWLPKTG